MKLIIYKPLIRPLVLYGHETWTQHAKDQDAFGVFERKVLRIIYDRARMEDGNWRRRKNDELLQLLREPTIILTTKIGRLRWAGHVIRMSDSNPTKVVLDRYKKKWRSVS